MRIQNAKFIVLSGLFFLMLLTLLLSCSKPGSDGNPAPNTDRSLPNGWDTVSKKRPLSNLYFVSPSTGYHTGLGFFETVDSGKTWVSLSGDSTEGIYFYNAQYGYVIGSSKFIYTSDGGANWKFSSHPIVRARAVMFVTPSTGFATGASGLYKTTDTGRTWQKLYAGNFLTVYFKDEQNGWISEPGKLRLLRSVNGGISFTEQFQDTLSMRPGIYAVFLADSQNGWASTFNNYILKTVDGGASWNKIQTGMSSSDVHFLNKDVGYLPGFNEVKKSTDGGRTWQQILKAPGTYFHELFFLNENLGWVADDNGNVYRWQKK